ncbi:MAG: 2-C-methyl-D-erythritol 4-phosphate cytidylyltransferase [Syntrophales bacterium]|nr:2-C-methyl-D-erythritol 4-phosphate cytidylyltransferase [Syntrophales bacterium]MDY0043531.1 2-C-methyl-D-erythritol 4-phosphate cytidylyltransferase [Syntrophales bacterium]
MSVVAVVVAGGRGKRMEGDIPKQYMMLGNKPILARTLSIFEKTDIVQDVIIAVPEQDKGYVAREIIEKFNLKKVSAIRPGGAQRQDTVKSAFEAVGNGTEIVIVHDGVRPFITTELINQAVAAARLYGAAVTAVPVKDTIKRAGRNEIVRESLHREELWSVQTPQVFRWDIIREAYDIAYRECFFGTDDAMLVERLGIPVKIIMGSYENIKVTTREDLIIGQMFLD